MAVKKATVDSTMAKVEAAKKETAKTETKAAPAKKEAAKPAAKATPAKKEAAKPAAKAPAKKEAAKPAAKAPAKKAAAKPAAKAPAKKAAPKAAAPVAKVFIEFNNGQVSADEITARAVEISGKKSVKDLNVYYQPETGMVYFTADGEEGSFAL